MPKDYTNGPGGLLTGHCPSNLATPVALKCVPVAAEQDNRDEQDAAPAVLGFRLDEGKAPGRVPPGPAMSLLQESAQKLLRSIAEDAATPKRLMW